MNVKGKVVKKLFGAGSKSEHDAVTLITDEGEYKLRRQNGNPFFDPELEKLVGKTIRCDGIAHDYTFIMSKCEELESKDHDAKELNADQLGDDEDDHTE